MALTFNEILNLTWQNNTVLDYAIASGIILGLFLIFKIFDYWILHKLEKFAKKTKTNWDDLIIGFIMSVSQEVMRLMFI